MESIANYSIESDQEESKDAEEVFNWKLKIFGNRPDVVFKTILRCFKKYFIKDFNRVTNYKKLKRRVTSKNQSLKDVIEFYVRL